MIHLDCIWLYDGLHSRPRGNCIDLHGICLLYAVRYTSTHFCGMLILAKRGYIGAMLPKYQDVFCLLAPQCSHNSKDSQQLQNDEPMHKVPALFTRNPSQSSWHAECGAAVISSFPFCSCFRRLAGSGIATKEFGKKNLTMLAVTQTSLHGGATTT